MWRFFGLLLSVLSLAEAARILAVVPTPSYSHQIVYQPIIKELAKRGHEIVYMTTNPVKDASLTTLRNIDWSHSYNIWNKHINAIIDSNSNPISFIMSAIEMINKISDYQLEHPEVQGLIKNETEHFDLLMIEYGMPRMMAFKERFNCPVIAMSSLEGGSFIHEVVGNAVHTVLYPEALFQFEGELSFFQRLVSIGYSRFMKFYFEYYNIGKEDAKVVKYFGHGYSNALVLKNSVDMIFTNANPIFNVNRPVTPATVNIGGGIHIQAEKPLPKELKQYLDDAKEGVIYLSLGSNVKSKDISIKTRELFMQVLGQLPYKILWKFESDDLPGKPNNVKIMKWVPQQDVLRHPNIKLFITQGGLQSLDEALFCQVPVLGLPFFGDQQMNAQKITSLGIGVHLDHLTMTSEEFKTALLEVIKNPKYKSKIKELADLARDEPMNALEKAVWWTEYVLRHKGAQHLKGPGMNIPAYQYYYLDVIAFLVLVISIISYVVYFVTKRILMFACRLVCKKKVKVQ